MTGDHKYGTQVKEMVDKIEGQIQKAGKDKLEGYARDRFFFLLDRFDDTVDQWKGELRNGRI